MWDFLQNIFPHINLNNILKGAVASSTTSGF